MTVGKVHDLLFRHAFQPVHCLHLLFPGRTVYKGLHKHVGTRTIVFKGIVVLQLQIVHHRGQQVVAELTFLQFLHLLEQQRTHLVECLSLTWCAAKDEQRVVHHRHHTAPCLQHLHLLIDVEVDKSGGTVAQHRLNHLQRVYLHRRGTVEAIAHPQRLCLHSNDRGVLWLCDFRHFGELWLLNVFAWLPLSEVLLYNGHHLIGIEVARHADCHVVGYVPLLEILLDVCDRGVLQVILRADGGLHAVRMMREQLGQQGIVELVGVVGQVDVILLVDGFQLRVESTNHHVLKTVRLNLGPVLYLIRGNVLRVARHVVAGVGIGAFGSDGRHQFVVFVGNEILGGQLAH